MPAGAARAAAAYEAYTGRQEEAGDEWFAISVATGEGAETGVSGSPETPASFPDGAYEEGSATEAVESLTEEGMLTAGGAIWVTVAREDRAAEG